MGLKLVFDEEPLFEFVTTGELDDTWIEGCKDQLEAMLDRKLECDSRTGFPTFTVYDEATGGFIGGG
jgi:hypothetical protein